MKTKTTLFAFLLFMLSIFNVLTPDKTFSSKENRYLKSLPKLSYNAIVSTRFGQEFDVYASDQFVFRDNWITLKTLADLSLLKQNNGRIYFGKDGFLFDKDIEFDNESFTQNLNKMKAFQHELKDNVKFTTMLIPGKSFALQKYLPKYTPILNETSIKKEISDNLGKTLDLYTELQNPSYYYKTDHHWTLSGAYAGYVALMNELELEPIVFEKELVNKDFLGTQYRKANYYKHGSDEIYRPIQDYGIINNIRIDGIDNKPLYDDTYLKKVDKYSYYLGGDAGLIEISTKANNNKKILIIKDSFANSLVPFLLYNFEDITIIDPRYYKGSLIDLINSKNIEEVVVMFNVENFGKKGRFAFL